MAATVNPAEFRKHHRETLRALARTLTLVDRPPSQLTRPQRKIHRPTKRHRLALAASICQRGFIVPIMITEDNVIIDGVLRCDLAVEAGLTTVPAIVVSGVTANERRLLSIALNRIPELAVTDTDAVVLELQDLLAAVDLDFTVEALGYSTAEIDVLFDASLSGEQDDQESLTAEIDPGRPVISRLGDLWLIDRRHRLLCGNARDGACYSLLFAGALARMVCTDHPFNVKIGGHVSGLGKHVHREFVEASGEMSSEEFQEFLTATLSAMTSVCIDGAIVIAAMDWRHMKEMIAAGAAAKLTLSNLCVWVKSNGGMGSLYRSQHELFFVWKHGVAPHVNNVMLGVDGRYRTNVWSAPGQNSFGVQRAEELSLHPTVKPVALVAEAIRDVTHHGDIVLDPFCGSGTILIAAEKTHRRAYAMELDPAYVDVAIRRYLAFRPEAQFILEATGETFAQVEARRAAAGDFDPEPVAADSDWDIV